jgi:DNA-binding response OmpR family regulator
MAKILVIDDHRELRELFTEVLVSAGHEVVTAADGSLGLALFARHRPSIVITDLEVPSISGLEVIDRLRGEPGVQIIAISGSNRENLVIARALGAAVTFKKPFSIRELTAAVRRLVGEAPEDR